jgi:anti-sigma B factor antagonist
MALYQENPQPEEESREAPEHAQEESVARVKASDIAELPRGALMELAGRLYLREAKELSGEMEALLKRDISKVIIDMSHVEYMNSSAIASLANCAAGAKGYGGNIVLMSLTPTIRNVLETLGLLGLFLTAETQEDAVKALS